MDTNDVIYNMKYTVWYDIYQMQVHKNKTKNLGSSFVCNPSRYFRQNYKYQPHGGTIWKVRLKSLGFILWATWMCVINFMEIFQTQQKWWTTDLHFHPYSHSAYNTVYTYNCNAKHYNKCIVMCSPCCLALFLSCLYSSTLSSTRSILNEVHLAQDRKWINAPGSCSRRRLLVCRMLVLLPLSLEPEILFRGIVCVCSLDLVFLC